MSRLGTARNKSTTATEPTRRNRELAEHIAEQMEAEFNQLNHKDRYLRFLKAMSYFTNYSVRNIMRIHTQKPGATKIAKYGEWRELGRQTRYGEKSFAVYVPVITENEETVKTEKIDPETGLPMFDEQGDSILEDEVVETKNLHYMLENVFDIAQTKPINKDEKLKGLVNVVSGHIDHCEVFIQALENTSPVEIVYEKDIRADESDGGADAAADAVNYRCIYGDKIIIRAGMGSTDTIASLFHGIAEEIVVGGCGISNINDNAKKDTTVIDSICTVLYHKYNLFSDAHGFDFYDLEALPSDDTEGLIKLLDYIRQISGRLSKSVDKKFIMQCAMRGLDYEEEKPEVSPETVVAYDERSISMVGTEHVLRDIRITDQDNSAEDVSVSAETEEVSEKTRASENEVPRYDGEEDIDTENSFIDAPEDSFAVYQLQDVPQTRRLKGQPMSALQGWGERVDRARYRIVYTGFMQESDTPGIVYGNLREALPDGFDGKPINVGDVFSFKQNGTIKSYFVDRNTEKTGLKLLDTFIGDADTVEVVAEVRAEDTPEPQDHTPATNETQSETTSEEPPPSKVLQTSVAAPEIQKPTQNQRSAQNQEPTQNKKSVHPVSQPQQLSDEHKRVANCMSIIDRAIQSNKLDPKRYDLGAAINDVVESCKNTDIKLTLAYLSLHKDDISFENKEWAGEYLDDSKAKGVDIDIIPFTTKNKVLNRFILLMRDILSKMKPTYEETSNKAKAKIEARKRAAAQAANANGVQPGVAGMSQWG